MGFFCLLWDIKFPLFLLVFDLYTENEKIFRLGYKDFKVLYNGNAPVAFTKGKMRMNANDDSKKIPVYDTSLEVIFVAELFSKLNPDHKSQVISLIKDLLSLE